MNTNPFSFQNPISDPRQFYGRQSEIRQVLARLLSNAHESTAIIGEGGMGKTSLLCHLSNPAVAGKLGIGSEYCLVYIDFAKQVDLSPGGFWRLVLIRLARSVSKPGLRAATEEFARRENLDTSTVEEILEQINLYGFRIVLLLDEFEHVTRQRALRPDFFGALRTLTIHNKLTFITATRRELEESCARDEVRISPFFKLFASVRLRPFSPTDAAGMIQKNASLAGVTLTEDEVRFAASMGGGIPFFTQMAAYYLIQARQPENDFPSVQNRAVAEFDAQAGPHFQELWKNSSQGEQIVLLGVIAMNNSPSAQTMSGMQESLHRMSPRASFDIPNLVHRGLLIEGEKPIFSIPSSLQRWIIREISNPLSKEATETMDEATGKPGDLSSMESQKSILFNYKRSYWPLIFEVIKALVPKMNSSAVQELAKNMFRE